MLIIFIKKENSQLNEKQQEPVPYLKFEHQPNHHIIDNISCTSIVY